MRRDECKKYGWCEQCACGDQPRIAVYFEDPVVTIEFEIVIVVLEHSFE